MSETKPKYFCPYCNKPLKYSDACVVTMGGVMTTDRQVSLLYASNGEGLVLYHVTCFKHAFGEEALEDVVESTYKFDKYTREIQESKISNESKTSKSSIDDTILDIKTTKKNNKLN